MKQIINLGLLIVATYCTFIISLPTAWGNELGFLPDVFNQFAKYSWQGQTLYLGQLVPWNHIPWHYIPVYLWATIPLWYSCLIVIGLLALIMTILKFKYHSVNFWLSQIWQTDLFIFLCGLLPLVIVIVSQAVVYNSWRHLYFIYGPLVYLMILGIQTFSSFKKISVTITLIVFMNTLIWMVQHHPYEFLYFNPLVRIHASENFERDYWGVVTLDLLKYILANDQREIIHIYKHDFTYKAIDLMLNKPEKARFKFVDQKTDADYLTHLFYNTQDRFWLEPGFVEIKSIDVDGVRAQSLYQRDESMVKQPPRIRP